MFARALGIRVAAIGAAAATIALVVLSGEHSSGFGIVRDSQPVEVPATGTDLSQRLVRLHTTLGIEPAQEVVWALFAKRMLDLDQLSRRFEAAPDAQEPSAKGERLQHAFLFAVALSEVAEPMSSRQSSILYREARSLGDAFICEEVRRDAR
ncbi:hypothetical protein LGR54_23420 [Ancylobacter sp. Lp-2]|uniref:hypothetical protein n=1 Tax=Ancylobacter sp. Lp-2 TaxID=2881339 RepID=UPI001E5853A7|nr:hypothetical protein [Ancylobacter sp. Lp-2]MCB4771565.1 hypothetical protein [Ancylobacter sp. Lp-2]